MSVGDVQLQLRHRIFVETQLKLRLELSRSNVSSGFSMSWNKKLPTNKKLNERHVCLLSIERKP